MRTPVPPDKDRFARLSPEPPAIIPKGVIGTLSLETTTEMIAKRERQLAHWTHRFPAWLEKQLIRWSYRP